MKKAHQINDISTVTVFFCHFSRHVCLIVAFLQRIELRLYSGSFMNLSREKGGGRGGESKKIFEYDADTKYIEI